MESASSFRALRDYFVAAIGLQRLSNRAVREFPPTRPGYGRYSGVGAEGILPICVALRSPPEESAVDQSLLLAHSKNADG